MQTAENSVAILMATYNGEKFIKQQLDSILNQSYKNIDIFISDDGSTDGTTKILHRYQEMYPNQITLLPSRENNELGACGNFFYLIANCPTEYSFYCFSDQDDIWYENKIESLVNAAASQANNSTYPILVYSDENVINESGKCIQRSFMHDISKLQGSMLNTPTLLAQNPVLGAAMLINKPLLDLVRDTKACDKIIMHDYWIALLASIFGKIVYVDSCLYGYRQHSNNEIGAYKISLISALKKMPIVAEKIREKRDQAKYLISQYDTILAETYRKMLLHYSLLSNYNKFTRIIYCLKHNILPGGLLRKIGFLIYI